jgi:methylenetetrahydrofolate dehydrogenase (NADP+)/methenyltetrahydrofolate cyclohydrolase
MYKRKPALIVSTNREMSTRLLLDIKMLCCYHLLIVNINGKQIAEEIKALLKERAEKLPRKPRLDIVYAGKDPIIENFLRIKLRAGEGIGAETHVHYLPSNVSQKSLLQEIRNIAEDKNSDGMIVQLPLPPSLSTEALLGAIPTEKDVDVLSENALLLFEQNKLSAIPPVAGAIAEILRRENVSLAGKNAVVVGNGRLVGRPASIWLKQNGANVTVLDKNTADLKPFLLKADIIVTGTGVPALITPDMIGQGVILFDAGASEESGEMRGDADNACSDKCAIFTPVPGGIGPITVAILFKNLFAAAEKKA